jgi:hypothetical protein
MNWGAQCRHQGASSFFRVAPRRKPPVMTEDKRAECARLLAEGLSPAVAARVAGV